MNQDNELKSIFQEQFETLTETAPQSVWGGLESQLAEMRTKRKRKLLFLWGASLLFIGAIAGAALLFSNDPVPSPTESAMHTSINQLTEQSDRSTDSKNQGNKQQPPIIAQNQLTENPENNLIEYSENELDEKQNPFEEKLQTKTDNGLKSADLSQKTIPNSSQKTSSTIGTSTNQTTSNSKTNEDLLTHSSTPNGAQVNPNGTESQNQRGSSESTDQKDKNQFEDKDSNPSNLPSTHLTGITAKPTTSNSLTTSNKVALMTKIAQKPALKLPVRLSPFPEIKITPLLPEKSNWELTIYGGGGRQIRKTNLNKDDLSYVDFSSTRPNTQAFHCSGVRISYFLGDHLSIGTGLETSVWRYRTRDYQKQLPLQENYEFDSPVGKLPASAADFNAFYANDPETDTILVKMRMIQRLRYIGIPLNLQYNFGANKVKPYIRMGVVGNFLVRQRTVLMAENSGIKREVNYKNIEGFNRFQLTLQPAIGLNWQLSKWLTFYCEGLINLPVTKFYTPPSGEFQKISSQGTGANMGIRIHF